MKNKVGRVSPTEAKALVKKIKKFVSDAGVSYSVAGQVLGVSKAALSRWMSGESLPFRYKFDSVSQRIDMLRACNQKRRVFAAMARKRPAEKAEYLENVLRDTDPL